MTTRKLAKTPETLLRCLTWDECELVDERVAQMLEDGEAENDEDAREDAWNDSLWFQDMFGGFLHDFSEILQAISPDGLFHVEGRNMGWRHLSGHADIQADDASRFIAKAFPKTSEWTFHGNFDHESRSLSYTLYHHDAPTGEFYEVTAGEPEEA